MTLLPSNMQISSLNMLSSMCAETTRGPRSRLAGDEFKVLRGAHDDLRQSLSLRV